MKKRSYSQNCALAHALDVVGERWSLLLIRELLIGPRRYRDLLKGLSGIGTNLLATRLKELEYHGIIEKTAISSSDSALAYQLTPRGRNLENAVFELIRWGLQLPDRSSESNLSMPEWDMVALQALFNKEEAGQRDACYQFVVDGVEYYAVIKDGVLKVSLGKSDGADLTIVTDRNTLSQAQDSGFIRSAMEAGDFKVTGNIEAMERLTKLFSLAENNN